MYVRSYNLILYKGSVSDVQEFWFGFDFLKFSRFGLWFGFLKQGSVSVECKTQCSGSVRNQSNTSNF